MDSFLHNHRFAIHRKITIAMNHVSNNFKKTLYLSIHNDWRWFVSHMMQEEGKAVVSGGVQYWSPELYCHIMNPCFRILCYDVVA